MRDAARQLTDGFHLLRAKKRLARLLERVVGLLQLGDVVRDAVDAEDFSAAVAINALRHQVGLRRARFARGQALERLRHAAPDYLPVGLDEPLRRLGIVQLEIVPADDLFLRLADEPRERVVHQHIAAREVFDEDRVRCRLDDGFENVRAVRNGHGCGSGGCAKA